MSQKIEDYGEKIGGAKKDLWKQRGLMVSDFKKMNDRESEKYVTKDNIWQKPDYMQLVQDGLDIKVAYFRKLVRDALPRKPVFSYYAITEEEKRAVVVRYIEFVRALKEAIVAMEKLTLPYCYEDLNYYYDKKNMLYLENNKFTKERADKIIVSDEIFKPYKPLLDSKSDIIEDIEKSVAQDRADYFANRQHSIKR